jgi:hypothetical protein
MAEFTRRAAVVLAAVGFVTASLPATEGRAGSAPADGTAEGTLTVNGKTTKVAFAYGPPNRFREWRLSKVIRL